jgi:hypothetical protein
MAPPVAPSAPKSHANSCAECRWYEAARAKTDYDPSLERLAPARNIPMMFSGAGAGAEDGADPQDDDGAFPEDNDEDDDYYECDHDDNDDPMHLREQLEPDDLWTELGSADRPKIVLAQPDAAASAAAAAASPKPAKEPLPVLQQMSLAGPAAARRAERTMAVHSATLNRLIQRLTPETGRPDRAFQAAFFMTYTKFTTTAAVVSKLLHRYFVPATESPPHRVLIRVCVLRALAALLVTHPRDLSPVDAKHIALLARGARSAGFSEDVESLEEAARVQ